jgi:hypothetical protein
MHAVFRVLLLINLLYWTVSLARKPRWRPWVLGFWAFETVGSLTLHDPRWVTVYAAVNLLCAHFAPLADRALARWADRLWEDLNR